MIKHVTEWPNLEADRSLARDKLGNPIFRGMEAVGDPKQAISELARRWNAYPALLAACSAAATEIIALLTAPDEYAKICQPYRDSLRLTEELLTEAIALAKESTP